MKVRITVSAGEQNLERPANIDKDKELSGAIAVALENFRYEYPNIKMLESGSVQFAQTD